MQGLAARGRAAVGGLDALAASFRPDVVHVHTVVNPAALEWAAARGAVLTVQDHRYFCPGRGRWTASGHVCREAPGAAACAPCFDDRAYFEEVSSLTAARLAAARAMAAIGVLSRYMRDELVANGVDPARVHVVPPGLDDPVPGPPVVRDRVLFAGRVAEAKGARDAVAAWRRSGVALPLVFAGTGPLRVEVESLGATVLGWLPAERLAAEYRRAAAVLLPSRWQEPFGMAGLEALAHGAPVVAWESGGVGEWHPGPLAAWGDVDALAARLAAVVRDPPPVVRPAGFERAAAMARLERLYDAARTGGPD